MPRSSHIGYGCCMYLTNSKSDWSTYGGFAQCPVFWPEIPLWGYSDKQSELRCFDSDTIRRMCLNSINTVVFITQNLNKSQQGRNKLKHPSLALSRTKQKTVREMLELEISSWKEGTTPQKKNLCLSQFISPPPSREQSCSVGFCLMRLKAQIIYYYTK